MKLLLVIPFAFVGAAVASITVSSDWGTTNAGTSSISSPTRTLTVPAGNPGNVKLNSTANNTDKYSKNGGANTTFNDGDVISVSNGDTLQLLITGAVSGDTETITVRDNTTNAVIGTAILHHT